MLTVPQRVRRRQPELGQQLPHRRETQREVKLPGVPGATSDSVAGPSLAAGATPEAPPLAITPGFEPPVDRHATEAKWGNDKRWTLAIA
jgi:hypothetical protein